MALQAKEPARALIALGSNLGDRARLIGRALRAVRESGCEILRISRLYGTAPVGAADRLFLNGAALIATDRSPWDLLRCLLEIERSLNRTRSAVTINRTIDLDIILWRRPDGTYEQLEERDLILPHPRARQRDFVMVPIAEIAPDWRFPGQAYNLSEEIALLGYRLEGAAIPPPGI